MSGDQSATPQVQLEAIRRTELNLLRLKVRPHRVRLACGSSNPNGQAAVPETRGVLFLFSDDSPLVDTEYGVFEFPQVLVDVIRQDETEPDGDQIDDHGLCTLGHVDTNESYLSARFVMPAKQFDILATLAASRPDLAIQMNLHCKEPLANWDGRQRLHIVRLNMESWLDNKDDTAERALRDPRNQDDPVALLEDIHAIPHLPEFLNLRRTVQLLAALLLVNFILLLWFGFSNSI